MVSLRAQLERAHTAEDNAAIVELARRIVAADPHHNDAWEDLITAQLGSGDLDRCERSLTEWGRVNRNPPAAIEDLWGDLLLRRKDYANAEHHWQAFLNRKPDRTSAADIYDKLAELCNTQERWADLANYRGKAITTHDSAARRVTHAVALLHLHQWDAAYAEMERARRMDSTDSQLKEWLPRFERLQNFLPQIRAVEAQLAKLPNSAGFLLDRARILTLVELPGVALEDGRRAMTAQPGWLRARIQTAETLLDDKRVDDANKLQVSRNLARGKDGHVSDQALRDLAQEDAAISSDPANAEAFASRSRTLRLLNQFVLALADANAALTANKDSANAHFEAANSLRELNQTKEALSHAVRATELNPNEPSAWFCRGIIEAARADFPSAVASQTQSIKLKESIAALQEREQCARRLGDVQVADADLNRIQQLQPPKQ